MLSVKRLVIRDDQTQQVWIDHLSFTANDFDKIAIIGSEGSGKSTLLSVLSGKEVDYVKIAGDIQRPKIIGYVGQNLYEQNLNETVESYINHRNPNALMDDIFRITQTLGLSYNILKNRTMKTLSGGERVKVHLASCLLLKPDILFLDEPSNDLDFQTVLFLEQFLLDIVIPVVFVSHDQRLLETVCNGVIHLEQIHKKTKAITHFLRVDYHTYKTEFLKKFESDWMISRKQRSDYHKKMAVYRQIYQKVEYRQNQAVRTPHEAQLLKKKIKAMKSTLKRFEKEKDNFIDIPEKEAPMHLFFEKRPKVNTQKVWIDLNLASFTLKDGRTLGPISLVVRGIDKIVILGDNGSGKTSLIQHILNQLKDTSIKVGYIPQNYTELLNETQDLVSFILERQARFNEAKLRQVMGTLGFKREDMIKPIGCLSEGTKLKGLLLMLVSNDYDLLILDEPTRNISPINQDEMYELFGQFDGAILAITHDRAMIETVFDDVYELNAQGLTKVRWETSNVS